MILMKVTMIFGSDCGKETRRTNWEEEERALTALTANHAMFSSRLPIHLQVAG